MDYLCVVDVRWKFLSKLHDNNKIIFTSIARDQLGADHASQTSDQRIKPSKRLQWQQENIIVCAGILTSFCTDTMP